MELLEVPALSHLHNESLLADIAQALDALPFQVIDKIPWPDAHKIPEVKFSMGYHQDCLFLKYYVKEEMVRARNLEINSPVYQDSCVEFFIAFNDEPDYYNLEFNCLGVCLAGFGSNQQNRKLLPTHQISKIKTWPSLQDVSMVDGPVSWQLTLAIPADVFCLHKITQFAGKQASVNFYKCGDELPHPHYLTWSPIRAPQPNFHLPEFFGRMSFI